jgi:hypothetical protein
MSISVTVAAIPPPTLAFAPTPDVRYVPLLHLLSFRRQPESRSYHATVWARLDSGCRRSEGDVGGVSTFPLELLDQEVEEHPEFQRHMLARGIDGVERRLVRVPVFERR